MKKELTFSELLNEWILYHNTQRMSRADNPLPNVATVSVAITRKCSREKALRE